MNLLNLPYSLIKIIIFRFGLRLVVQVWRIISGRPVYRYSQIVSGLYVGGQHRRHGWASMQAKGITAVVNMRRSDDGRRGVASAYYLHLATPDNRPPTLENLHTGVAFIQQIIIQGGSVYVHCGVGVGRAPAMAAAYLVSTGHTPAQAWAIIRHRRPIIWPTRGQQRRIEEYAGLLGKRINHNIDI